jgi:hypothetical protein
MEMRKTQQLDPCPFDEGYANRFGVSFTDTERYDHCAELAQKAGTLLAIRSDYVMTLGQAVLKLGW